MTAWEGVTFGKASGAYAGRVVKLDLSSKGLTGEVPAALGAGAYTRPHFGST